MNNQTFDDFLQRKFELIIKTRAEAQKDYATEQEVFSNFIEDGKELKLTPMQALHVHLSKHERTIKRYVSGEQVEGRESIEGRIKDAILYLFLLWGMVHEKKQMCEANTVNLGQLNKTIQQLKNYPLQGGLPG